jgi:hypothetical protein
MILIRHQITYAAAKKAEPAHHAQEKLQLRTFELSGVA